VIFSSVLNANYHKSYWRKKTDDDVIKKRWSACTSCSVIFTSCGFI